jgi:aminopyrrolnitrin oxygenase
MLIAPEADRFPAYPSSWYLFGRSADLRHGPVARAMFGRQLVAYRTADGKPVILDARCSHLGSDLSKGSVIDDCIRCPFHHWQYGPDGRCIRLPSGKPAPATARQRSYPVEERHGFLFLFNGTVPLFSLPFFPDCRPEDYTPARPFYFHLDCPWYLIGSNAVDLQHFHAAHDRELVGRVSVTEPARYCCRIACKFRIVGRSLHDRLTRFFGGNEVAMDTTDWSGNLFFTTASLARTCTRGMVISEPLPAGGVRIAVIIHVLRRPGLLGRLTVPLQRSIRRHFIKAFLDSDAERLDGARYNPLSLVEDDYLLAEYFRWLADTVHGGFSSECRHPEAAREVQQEESRQVPSRPAELRKAVP